MTARSGAEEVGRGQMQVFLQHCEIDRLGLSGTVGIVRQHSGFAFVDDVVVFILCLVEGEEALVEFAGLYGRALADFLKMSFSR